MSAHYVVLVVFFLLMALVPYRYGNIVHEDDEPLELVPSDSIEDDYSTVQCGRGSLNIVLASTINGVLTALDGETGELLWRYDGEPLLQGTLSTSGPINVGGTDLQLIPTLDGRLFSYAHDSNLIEPLSVTTESLLESTVRLGRDAVAGGKSVSTVGIDLVTGEIRYKCSLDSCANTEQASTNSHYPTLLVKRISNSIRALDSVLGTERWNLSTAEIDCSIAGIGAKSERKSRIQLLLRPPDGIITANTRFNNEEWKTNVGGHIANVWHVFDDSIKEVSLFDPKNIWTTQYEVGHRKGNGMAPQSSLFYMGTSNGYPFIIQSQKAKKTLKKKMSDMQDMENDAAITLTGVSSCSANSASNGLGYEVEDNGLLIVLREAFGKSHSKMIEDNSVARSQSRGKLTIVAHNADPQAKFTCTGRKNSGVSLIGAENLRSTSMQNEGDHGYLVLDSDSCRRSYGPIPLPVKMFEGVTGYIKYLIGFLASTFSFTFFAYYRRRTDRSLRAIQSSSSIDSEVQTSLFLSKNSKILTSDSSEDKKDSNVKVSEVSMNSEAVECIIRSPLKEIKQSESPKMKTSSSQRKKRESEVQFESSEDYSTDDIERKRLLRSRTISRSSLETFRSRFADEFEVQKLIGHGGFGVVFQAKSLVDENKYAVKRIAVADNEKARDRVLREARALALFDHPGIIRYFYAWEERPPRGFQEKEDEILLGKMRSEKLKNLHNVKKLKRIENIVKSGTQSLSMVESFEMPPVVGHTADDSWNTENKPERIVAGRTTSESKRGLAGEDFESDSMVVDRYPSEDGSSSSSSSDCSSDSSDSEEESGYRRSEPKSSSGGIEFVNDSEDKLEKNRISQDLSLKNKAVLDATENNEIELREINEPVECAYLYIVMQLCAERTLESWIHRNKTSESRNLATMKQWIKQLAEALEYLHAKGYIHRDLKPGNVFFSLDSTPNRKILKIGDLGLATKTDKALEHGPVRVASDGKHTKNVGTRSYMSPEQLSNQRYTEKIDIFALGLVATELIIPFSTGMERMQTFTSFQKGAAPEILKENLESREFLMQLTNVDASARPTAQEIANHAFLS